MNFSYNTRVNILHRCTTLHTINMIFKKSNKLTKNCIRCSRNVKGCSEKKLKPLLLHTIKSNFRKAVKILGIVQGLPKLRKCMNISLQNFTFPL